MVVPLDRDVRSHTLVGADVGRAACVPVAQKKAGSDVRQGDTPR